MKAIVCDKCGNVILLDDDKPYQSAPAGVFVWVHDKYLSFQMELCEDCGDEIVEAVRNMKTDAQQATGKENPL